ncbi:10928_t:CDS:2 [Dentiscutata erythropus]|uniref:10928_t:CDS:1 n=1 Tax=Dentiscutata erythropus TaxID=1348616 RepID=A0A9N8Z284_9GLOM|nr:10928_t:CDS:2 [Dentiscutata erythropus]
MIFTEKTLPSLKEINDWDSPFWIFESLSKRYINGMFYNVLKMVNKDQKAPEALLLVIKKLLKQKKKKLIVALDEVQELIDQFQNKFKSTTSKNMNCLLYSVIIRVFSIEDLCVILLGTGLIMKLALDHTGLHIIKEESGMKKLHKNILKWLIGRARFSTSFVEEWLCNTSNLNLLFETFKK